MKTRTRIHAYTRAHTRIDTHKDKYNDKHTQTKKVKNKALVYVLIIPFEIRPKS